MQATLAKLQTELVNMNSQNQELQMEIRKGTTGEAMTADASRQQTALHFRSLY